MSDVAAASVDSINKPEDVAAFEAKASGSVKMIPLSLIRKNDVALRDEQRESEDFLHLEESIRTHGVFNSILVREQRGPTGELTYGLVDGLQRFTACSDLGILDIPARIVTMDDAEVLEAQIITNVTRIETKPAELSKHLMRILGRNPMMTRQELADKVCQSTAWLDERLSLNNLVPEIATLVDAGSINLSNAYALSKLPKEEQPKHVDAAMTEPHKTFVPRMKERVKEIREAKKSGRDASGATFQPIQYLQKITDVKAEFASGQVRDSLLTQAGVNTAEGQKAWETALLWFMHFDEASKAAQLQKHEERETKRKVEAEKRKAENKAKKEQTAAEKAADINSGW